MALPSYIPTISFAVYDAPVAHTSLNHRPPQVHFFFFSSPFSCVTDFPNPIKRCPAFAPWFYCFSVATGEEGQVFMHLNFCPRIEEQIGRKVPSSLLPACLLELSVHKIFFARSSLVSRPRSPFFHRGLYVRRSTDRLFMSVCYGQPLPPLLRLLSGSCAFSPTPFRCKSSRETRHFGHTIPLIEDFPGKKDNPSPTFQPDRRPRPIWAFVMHG